MSSPGLSVRSDRWPAALAAALLWALAAASLALWWLHLPQTPLPDAAVARMERSDDTVRNQGTVERALGHTTAAPAAPDAQKRFAVLGVIASGSGQGSALLVVDGQPARAFRRGQEVADGWRLSSVGSTGVRLETIPPGAGVTLMLPERR